MRLSRDSTDRRFREECLHQNWFMSLGHTRQDIKECRVDYNMVRPYSSLGDMTPEDFRLASEMSWLTLTNSGPSSMDTSNSEEACILSNFRSLQGERRTRKGHLPGMIRAGALPKAPPLAGSGRIRNACAFSRRPPARGCPCPSGAWTWAPAPAWSSYPSSERRGRDIRWSRSPGHPGHRNSHL